MTLVGTDVSEERIASVISVKRISELGTMFLRSVLQLLVAANVILISLIIFTLMEAIRSSETSLITRATRRHIPEYGILLFIMSQVKNGKVIPVHN
jgi:hypothetical protein